MSIVPLLLTTGALTPGAGGGVGLELWDGVGVTVGTGWTDNMDGSYTHSSGVDTVRDNIGLATGTTYRTVFAVTGRTAGNVKLVLGGNSSGTLRTTNDTFTEDIVGGTNALLYVQPTTDFDGTVSAISCKEVL